MRDTEGTRWARVFGPHLDAAYRLGFWLTGNRAEAQEVVQDACLRSWRASGRDPDDPRAWLLAIVRNLAWTRLRRRAGTNVIPFDDAARELERAADMRPGAEAALGAAQRTTALRRALAALPAPFREVVVLRDIEELSYREIATLLDLPAGTVMSRLARGRRRLRDLLAREIGDARDAV